MLAGQRNMTDFTKATAEELVIACTEAGVRLRINPTDKKLTAIPYKTLAAKPDLLEGLRRLRAEVYEFVNDRDGGTEITIEDLPPEAPPEPSVAEQIIAECKARGIKIGLDMPSSIGRLKCITPWEGLPDMAGRIADPDGSIEKAVAGRQRSQLPQDLAVAITNNQRELLAHLRAPYMPKLEPLPENATKMQRSIWERIAQPDNLMPDAAANQERIKTLLFGDAVLDPRQLRRQAMINQLPQRKK
jgi:hypothetical protein